MRYLGDLAGGRDNNLNLIRAVAATAVLVSHAWPIALGPGATEPLRAATGHSLGSLSVLVFFAISGFLITGSFQRSSSSASFTMARVLRLFPGLLINLLLVAFVLGPLVSNMGAAAYLSRPEPYTFVLRDLALFPLVFHLPGVFDDQPYTAVVGSIWTLRHEVMCYIGVLIAGIIGAWRGPGRAATAFALYAAVWLSLAIFQPSVPGLLRALPELSLPFALGAAACIWRDRIPLSLWGVAGSIALAWALHDSPGYFLALSLALTYTTLWLAYVPEGRVRGYNRIGDYSYGIYIYAFPLQGLAVWLFGPQTPWQNVAYALPMTLMFSIVSWHLVEAPAMAQKPRLMAFFAWRRAAAPVNRLP